MGALTKIEWANHTFNPWIGCTKVDALCTNCYAESDDKRRKWTPAGWGKGKPRRRTGEANWKEPLRWDVAAAGHRWAKCQECGKAVGIKSHFAGHIGEFPCDCGGELVEQRPRVFSASLADVWDEEVCAAWRADFLGLVMQTPHLDWLLLSKRPGNWRQLVTEARDWQAQHYHARDSELVGWLDDWLAGTPPTHVWIGASVGTQAGYDERVGELFRIPARVHFLSMEPLLEAVRFERVPMTPSLSFAPFGPLTGLQSARIDWVIAGGESGPKARLSPLEGFRAIRDACAAAQVPFLFKQWGEWAPFATEARYAAGSNMPGNAEVIGGDCGGPSCIGHDTHPPTVTLKDGRAMKCQVLHVPEHKWGKGDLQTMTYCRVGKLKAGRLLDGVEHNGFPIVRGGRA